MALKYEYEDNNEIHIKSEDFLVNEKELRRRARADKKLKRRYKFTDKDHSRPGIVSSILALAALIILIAAIVLSTLAHGNGNWLVGLLGALSFVYSFAGAICGIVAFRNTDVLLKYAWLGMISNTIIWLITGTLIVLGL